MLKLTSKTGTIKGSGKAVYQYISDFRNFSNLLPSEQLNHLKVSEDKLEFGMDGFGNIGMQIAEKNPFKQLIIKAIEGTAVDFTFNIQIDEIDEKTSASYIILEAQLNMFIEMMAKAPLQRFLDLIIDKLGTLDLSEKV